MNPTESKKPFFFDYVIIFLLVLKGGLTGFPVYRFGTYKKLAVFNGPCEVRSLIMHVALAGMHRCWNF